MIRYPKITLKHGKEEPLKRFHPWIFSGSIDRTEAVITEGDVVEVFASDGRYLATGHAQAGSLAVKILTFRQQEIGPDFWRKRLSAAYALRRTLGLTDNPGTNAYRLVYGEGDFLPGLVVDHYAGTLILQAHSVGMYLALPEIAAALQELYGDHMVSAYSRSAEVLSRLYRYEVTDEFLFGDTFSERFLENGITYRFDPLGQKTGFFCDQRENRHFCGQLAAGRKVLDVFCNAGGFGLNALAGGAQRVVSVDSARSSLTFLEDNLALNPGISGQGSIILSDARMFMLNMEDSFDLIILDPPAFAKHQADRGRALQGYKNVNLPALKKIAPGGYLLTFSCSQVIDRLSFQSAVMAAAIEAGRKIRVLRQLGQAGDHPVSVCHPEGEYLKGLLLYVS